MAALPPRRGIQLFALLHVALVLVALEGFRRVVLELPWARAFAFAFGLAGLGAFAVHMTFLALGHSEFRLPASIVLLVALAISGSGQAAAALVHPRFAFARLSS